MRNKLLAFCLVFLLLTVFPLTAAAEGFDSDKTGSISVSLVSNNEIPMVGAELSVFYVATVKCNADGKLLYTYTGAFADCGISLDDPELIAKLDAFVAEHPVDHQKIVTDSNGNAFCEDLSLGLYFVKQTGEAKGFVSCASFLVTMPLETEEGFIYHVDASPKTDVVRLIDITLQKVWNVDKAEVIPTSVTVQLLRGDTVLYTEVLDAQKNWQTIFHNMPESDIYRIREIDVPKGFTATYSQNGYVFTVTNTSSLAQTGQLIWPIPVLAAAGIFLLLAGFALLRKTGKNHG